MTIAAQPVLRLTLPPGWRESADVSEGQPLRVFHPPAPAPGVLRLLTDRIAAGGDGATVAVKMREVALRFVRPDDARAGDRIIEDWVGGGIIASATLAAVDEATGRAETHYLWMLALPAAGTAAVDAAMAALAMPRELDGDVAAAAVVETADAALRAAALVAG